MQEERTDRSPNATDVPVRVPRQAAAWRGQRPAGPGTLSRLWWSPSWVGRRRAMWRPS